MKKVAMIFSGIILVLGCITLAFSLLVSSVLPNLFLVYLTANPVSFSHEILYPNMTGLYVFSGAKIIFGTVGLVYFGSKMKD
ncbi:MAG: hypothetical protein FWE12_05360 [Oscillospiraceae bacterium]|nr:hypothetical protein [Oscillospiraceae bacterium]